MAAKDAYNTMAIRCPSRALLTPDLSYSIGMVWLIFGSGDGRCKALLKGEG